MASLDEHLAILVNGEAVSLGEVLRTAKWRKQLQFIREAADATLVRQQAAKRGIGVSDDELQQASDDFRAANGLYDAETTENWLAANYLTYEDWEIMLEHEVIVRKLRDALSTGKVEEHFAINKLSFDAATISQLVVDSEDMARELRAQIIEENADFYTLARQHSVDTATKHLGGYTGRIRRIDMEAAIEAAVFGAQPGKIVGPFKIDAGWALVKVEAIHPATLNDATRESIKSMLFDEWLSEQRRKAKISVPLLKPNSDGE